LTSAAVSCGLESGIGDGTRRNQQHRARQGDQARDERGGETRTATATPALRCSRLGKTSREVIAFAAIGAVGRPHGYQPPDPPHPGWPSRLALPLQRAYSADVSIARPLARTGWDAEIWAPETTGEPYSVVAERTVILTPDLVRTSREMFEQVTSLMPGAEYDGWEVAISEDKYLEPGAYRPERTDR
jgi:hypothetical protein